MKRLNQYIKDNNESSLISLKEKLIINKDFVYVNYDRIKCTNYNVYDIVNAEVHKQSGNGQTRLHPIDLNHIDVSEVIDMSCLFDAINDEVTLRYIDISKWDVHNVVQMKWMFGDCKELVSIGDLSNWDVRKLKDAGGMFKNCKKLEYVGDISKWNLESIDEHDIDDMFTGCKKLIGNVGDLTKWNISIGALQKLKIQGILP